MPPKKKDVAKLTKKTSEKENSDKTEPKNEPEGTTENVKIKKVKSEEGDNDPSHTNKKTEKKTTRPLKFVSWNCSRPKWIDDYKPTEDVVAIQFSRGQDINKVKDLAIKYGYEEKFIFTGYNAILLKKDCDWVRADADDNDDDFDPRIAHLRIKPKEDSEFFVNIFSAYLNATEIKKAGAEKFYENLNRKIKSKKEEVVLLMASLGSAIARPNALELEPKDSYINSLEIKGLKPLICEKAFEANSETQCTYREQRDVFKKNDPSTSLIDYIYYSKNIEEYFDHLRWNNPEVVVKYEDGTGKGTQHLKIKGVFHNGKTPKEKDDKSIVYDHYRKKEEACKKGHKKPIQYLIIAKQKLDLDDKDYIHVENKGFHFYIGKKYTEDVTAGKIKEIHKRVITKEISQKKENEDLKLAQTNN